MKTTTVITTCDICKNETKEILSLEGSLVIESTGEVLQNMDICIFCLHKKMKLSFYTQRGFNVSDYPFVPGIEGPTCLNKH